jgi:replicative DNA helicase
MQNYGTLEKTVVEMESQAKNKIGELEKMESRLKELDREIDTEHMENYLVYRLEDVRDLVNSLKPYTKDNAESCLIKQNDAIQKMSVLQGEVRKMELELE